MVWTDVADAGEDTPSGAVANVFTDIVVDTEAETSCTGFPSAGGDVGSSKLRSSGPVVIRLGAPCARMSAEFLFECLLTGVFCPSLDISRSAVVMDLDQGLRSLGSKISQGRF